jgi:tRNA dimethylallyltransferase
MNLPVICLTGPTAAGKSAATLALARRWPIEIINMDSATIYRGMDIGTAKPSAEEQAQVRHHLLDIRDPAQNYSAAEFARDANQCIGDIFARGKLPLLSGGTLMYYKALREGLNELPPANPALRGQIDEQARQKGWPALHAELAGYDPLTAERLAPNDSQRLQRAIEVYRSTGKPLSAWLNEQRATPSPYRFATVSLEPSNRLALHERIARRYRQMLDQGLLDEVRVLHQRPDLHPGLPSIRCVGYRQLWDHLEGATSLEQAVDQAIAATRQLAKRQLTWLRSMPERIVIDCLSETAVDQVTHNVERIWPNH